MTDNYLGEIRAFSFNYAPQGWALCDGSILQISANTALYSLIGTFFGGDGQKTFALPDLRGRVPVCLGTGSSGTNYQIGNKGGLETVPLVTAQIPSHSHGFVVENSAGNQPEPDDILAIPHVPTLPAVQVNIYNASASPGITLNADTLQTQGGGIGHNNMQPFETINFCIATQGIYPSRP